MFKEFKQFAFKGNVVDLAVGFILGAGFTGVVKSLVTHVIMPPLGLLTGGIDFTKLAWTIKEAKGEEPAVVIKHGQFVDELLAFLILAFAVFIIVKKLLVAKKEEEKAAPPKPPKQEVLLEQILDELKKQSPS